MENVFMFSDCGDREAVKRPDRCVFDIRFQILSTNWRYFSVIRFFSRFPIRMVRSYP